MHIESEVIDNQTDQRESLYKSDDDLLPQIFS